MNGTTTPGENKERRAVREGRKWIGFPLTPAVSVGFVRPQRTRGRQIQSDGYDASPSAGMGHWAESGLARLGSGWLAR